MLVQFLSEANHARPSIYPNATAPDDLDTNFQLSAEDLKAVRKLRGDANRLSFALQLCCSHFLGFFPSNLHTLGEQIVTYVGGQPLLNP